MSPGSRQIRWAAAVALAAFLVACPCGALARAAEEKTPTAGEGEGPRREPGEEAGKELGKELGGEVDKELARLKAELDALLDRHDELERRVRRLRGPLRTAVEEYLEARGVTGLAFTDRDLRRLDSVLTRATVGAEVRIRYGRWDDLLDLDTGRDDIVDFSEVRSRLVFGYALVGGPEIEIELQGLARQGGVFEHSPLEDDFPPADGVATDPGLALPRGPELEFRRAVVSLPAFNLFGRLAHVPVFLDVGRQEIAFGDGFLLGDDEDGAGIAYDALRLHYESGAGGRVDLFAGRAAGGARTVAAHIAGPIDPSAEPRIDVAGVRAESRGILPDTRLAAYFVTARVGAFGGDGFAEVPTISLHTLGVEASCEVTTRSRLRLNAAVQRGGYGAQEIRDSGAATFELELTPPEARGLGGAFFLGYGSGDEPDTTDDFEGFIPIAQDSYRRWDALGILSSRNTAAWGAECAFTAEGGSRLGLRWTQAYAPEPESPAGLLLRDAAPGAGNRIGGILSVFADFRLFDEEKSYLRIAYSHFSPGDYFAPPADAAEKLRVELGFAF